MDPRTIAVEQSAISPIRTVSQWLLQGRALRAHHWAHNAFRIRLGRSISLTVPRN